jgi:hypothetical protein
VEANPRLIDYETAADILARRGIPPECPVCGHNAWARVGPLDNLYLFLPVADEHGNILESGGIKANSAALGLACGNCAFLKLLSVDLLNRIDSESEPPAHTPNSA